MELKRQHRLADEVYGQARNQFYRGASARKEATMKIVIGIICLFLGSATLAQDFGHKDVRTVRVVSGEGAGVIASAVEMRLRSIGRYKVISDGIPELVLGISCTPIKEFLACSYVWQIFGHRTEGGLVVLSDQSVIVDGIVNIFRAGTTEKKLFEAATDISMYVRDYCEHAESANAKPECSGDRGHGRTFFDFLGGGGKR